MRYEFRDERGGRIDLEYPMDGSAPKIGESVVVGGRKLTRIISGVALAAHTMGRHVVKGRSLPRRGKDVVPAPHYDSDDVAVFHNPTERADYCARRTAAGAETVYEP